MHGGIPWFRRHFATKSSRRAGTRDLGNRGEGAYRACVPIRKTADEGESNEGDRQKKADALGHGAASAFACIWGEGRRGG